jgi:hypothetical protein
MAYSRCGIFQERTKTVADPQSPYWKRVLRYVFLRNEACRFRSRIVPGLVTVLIVILVNGVGHMFGSYEKFELADSDLLDRFETTERSRAKVSVVLIKESTYRDRFNNRSPLTADPLLRIVEAVCSFNPRAVGVDIFTGEWDARDKPDALRRVSALAQCPIVWVRDTSEQNEAEPGESYVLGSVLGDAGPSKHDCAAAPVTQPDVDGVVRRYRTTIPAVGAGAGGVVAPYYTLIGALTGAPPLHCGAGGVIGQKDQRIRFSAEQKISRINAELVVNPDSTSNVAVRQVLNQAIVIIGGAYRSARDQYLTPIGPRYGAEIQAIAIAADPIKEVRLPVLLSVEFAVDITILALMVWSNLRYPWALLVTLLANTVWAFVISWILFNYQGYFLSVFGALAGALLGIVAEVVSDPLREDFRHWRSGIPKLGLNARLG